MIQSRDVKLAASAFGPPDGVPVVLLHGGGQTRQSWRDTAAELAAGGWSVLSVDQRGHGDSEWSPDGRYDIERFADDVIAIVDHLVRKPVLVGASLGGCAALAALGHQPELARGLVLVDVSPFMRPDGRDRIMDFMTARPEGSGSLEEAADAVAADLPHRPRPSSLAGLAKNLREREGRLFWHWDPRVLNPPAEDAVLREVLTDPVRLGAATMTLRVPTLLIRGGESHVLGLQDARRFLALAPHIAFCEIDGARHMVAGDENTRFGVVVEDFLEAPHPALAGPGGSSRRQRRQRGRRRSVVHMGRRTGQVVDALQLSCASHPTRLGRADIRAPTSMAAGRSQRAAERARRSRSGAAFLLKGAETEEGEDGSR